MQGIGKHTAQQAITRHHIALQNLRIADTIQQGISHPQVGLGRLLRFLDKMPGTPLILGRAPHRETQQHYV